MSFVHAIAQSSPAARVSPGRPVSERRSAETSPASRDRVTISAEARRLADAAGASDAAALDAAAPADTAPVASTADGSSGGGDGSTASGDQGPGAGPGGSGTLDPSDQARVADLQRIDRQVRAHEAAHMSAGGSIAGAANYSYSLGPDGKRYAVAGEVPITMGGGSTPDAVIAIAERVRRAALAPADPSAQDLSVAASASAMEASARAQKARAASQAYAASAARSRAAASAAVAA